MWQVFLLHIEWDILSVEYGDVARARFNNTMYASRGCSDAYLENSLDPDINLKCPFLIAG